MTVAVLPFQNAGSDHTLDFLRLALPDEIATTLSYKRSLSIRPFANTSKYTESNLDLQKAGREMGVTNIVTGHFLKGADQLQVTLEAVDVESNRLLWRDTLDVPAGNMIAMPPPGGRGRWTRISSSPAPSFQRLASNAASSAMAIRRPKTWFAGVLTVRTPTSP